MLLKSRGLETTIYSRDSNRTKKANLVQDIGISYISAQDVPNVTDLAKRFERIDVMLEATGAAAVAAQAMQLVPANGILCLLSVTGEAKRISWDVAAVNQRLVLGNGVVFGSVNSNRGHFLHALTALGAFDERWPGVVRKLISRRVPLASCDEAFTKRPGDIKVVIEISAPGRRESRRSRARE